MLFHDCAEILGLSAPGRHPILTNEAIISKPFFIAFCTDSDEVGSTCEILPRFYHIFASLTGASPRIQSLFGIIFFVFSPNTKIAVFLIFSTICHFVTYSLRHFNRLSRPTSPSFIMQLNHTQTLVIHKTFDGEKPLNQFVPTCY